MNLKKLSIIATASALTLSSMVMTPFAHASSLEDAKTLLNTSAGEVGGTKTQDIPQTVASLVNVVLLVLGMLLFLYFFYAGFLWMTAGGEAEKVKKAKTIIINSTIGLLIVLSAWSISSFVLNRLISATAST